MVHPDIALHSNGEHWRAVWYDAAGRRQRRSLGRKDAMTRMDALGRIARLAHELRLEGQGGLPTLAGLDGVAQHRRGVKAATRAMQRHTVLLLCEWADGHLPGRRHTRIDHFTRADASDFAAWLDAGSGGAMGAVTVARHLRQARALWNAVGDDLEGVPFANPFARRGWRVPRIAQDWHEVTHDDLSRLMKIAPPSIATALALARLAGLRLGEIERLRWSDVDLPRRSLRILPGPNERGEREENTKQRARTVPIRPELAAVLTTARGAGENRDALVCPDLPNRHNLRRALVGGGAGGRRLASGKPRRYIGLVEKAGLPVYAKPMHTLRRNCGTEWAEQGIPLADLAKWMGNSVAVAAEYYVRTTPITFARVTGLTNEQANARPTATGNRRKSGNSNALGR